MNHHDCLGLKACIDHPRWHVIRVTGDWYVMRRNYQPVTAFPTHTEAISYAQNAARIVEAARLLEGTTK